MASAGSKPLRQYGHHIHAGSNDSNTRLDTTYNKSLQTVTYLEYKNKNNEIVVISKDNDYSKK